jgi:transposase, IS5 family
VSTKTGEGQLPIDPSSLTRWRERIGASGMEQLLAATIDAAVDGGAVKPSSLERVTVETTVQPKAIAFPTDSRLYHRGREILVRLAGKHGIRLRQSYHRLGKRALRLANRYAHSRQMRRARREIRRLKTFLGRVARDIGRKIADRPALAPHFAEALARVTRVLAQQKTDHGKLYTRQRSSVWPRARRTSATSSASRSRSPPPTARGSSWACWRCPAIPTMVTRWPPRSPRSSA